MEIIDQQEGPKKSVETVLSEGYQFKLSEYLGGAFRLFGKDAGIYLGFCLVYGMITIIGGMIPFIGTLVGIAIGPPLAAGWYIYANKQGYDRERSFNNFFDGFKEPYWLQLVLQSFITNAFAVIAFMIVAVPFFIGDAFDFESLESLSETKDPEMFGELVRENADARAIGGLLLAGLVCLGVFVMYAFAPLFIVFRKMGFWEAMEASRKIVFKNYFAFVALLLVLGFLNCVGVIPCCLGLLVTVPVSFLAIYSAFDDIMGAN